MQLSGTKTVTDSVLLNFNEVGLNLSKLNYRKNLWYNGARKIEIFPGDFKIDIFHFFMKR